MITKKQYEKLTPYREHLWTAVQVSYARAVGQAGFEELDKIYREIFKRDSGLLSGCSRCRLQGLKDLGKLYFEYEKAAEKKAKEQAEAEIVSKKLEPDSQVIDNQAPIENKANTKSKTKK